MLIVSRKVHTPGAVGSSFTMFDADKKEIALVRVLRIDRSTVKLGFLAAGEVVILRKELIDQGARRAATSNPAAGMLVLSRRTDEEVHLFVGGVMVAMVKIVRTEGNLVKIGVEADREKVIVQRDDTEQELAKWTAKQAFVEVAS